MCIEKNCDLLLVFLKGPGTLDEIARMTERSGKPNKVGEAATI